MENNQHFSRSIFQYNLLKWGKDNFRSYPWRLTKDPFKILLAEMMLHRTKSDQVEPVYNELVLKFPSSELLSNIELDTLYEIIRPIGLNWRIKNIHDAVKYISKHYHNNIPDNLTDLKRIPGVGDYIASAVLCMAYNKSAPVLDVNIVRVVGRIFDIEIAESSRRAKKYKEKIVWLMDGVSAKQFLFSILDFASIICTLKNPKCVHCSLLKICSYGLKHEKNFN